MPAASSCAGMMIEPNGSGFGVLPTARMNGSSEAQLLRHRRWTPVVDGGHAELPAAGRQSRRPGRVGCTCRYPRPRLLHRDPGRRRRAAGVPLLRGAAAPHVRRPRHVAAVRELRRRPSASTRWSRSTRCTRRSASAACSCSSRSTSPPRTSSPSTPTSRRTRTPGSSTRAPTSRWRSSASASGPTSLVVEVASNDGYLLQHFVERGIPALGIEPAANVAEVAREHGIATIVRFFGRELAARARGRGAPRRPDRRQQRAGAGAGPQRLRRRHRDRARAARAWSRSSSRTCMRLIEDNQFDTIYHEHFSYFSFLVRAAGVRRATASRSSTSRSCRPRRLAAALRPARADRHAARSSERVHELVARERALGFDTLEAYLAFRPQVEETKRSLLEFLIAKRREGKRIAATGRPARATRC